MGTKYSSTLPTGYNSNPPADDGSQVASNKVKYSTIKSKLADPLNDFASALDTALQAAFDTSSSIVSVDYTTVASDHLKPIECSGTITISLGDATTMESGYRAIVANVGTGIITVGVATDTDTLNGATDGTITLRPNDCATFTVNQGADGYEIVSAFVATPGVTAISADRIIAATDFPGVFNCTSDVTISLGDPADVTPNLPLTIVNSSTGVLTVSPLAGDTIDGVSANYTVPVGSRITLISTGSAWLNTVPSGGILQVQRAEKSTLVTCTTIMTTTGVPQNTDGDEVLTCPITPKSTTSKLLVRVDLNAVTLATATVAAMGLFQDTTAAAIAANFCINDGHLGLEKEVDSTATTETTFKVRAGPTAAGSAKFNIAFGNVGCISMTVTEIAA